MASPPVVPKGDALRRAVAWLAERHDWTAATIEEASRRFDLDPLDEEFLLRELRRRQATGDPG